MVTTLTKFRFVFLFSILSGFVFSQAKQNLGKLDVDDANEHFKHLNYTMAMPIYKNELKKDPDNDFIRIRLAQCYLSTRINREEAVVLLEKVVKKNPNDDVSWKELARAYHLVNKLDQAEAAYKKYLELKPKKEAEIRPFLKQIIHARNFMNNPANVTLQNLGPEINSDEPDYYPFVSGDETFLVFTSRRKDNIGGKKIEMDGLRNSDIYFSKVENGKWAKALNAGKSLNTQLDEQVVGIRPDGNEIVVYIDHIDKFGDLYITS
ncbi:MAG: tetratricopeptide repeat protein, partial [Bacteroidia bacterium]|nr:tetratricopeptide repeat protein [Bacteroidia bacterium]